MATLEDFWAETPAPQNLEEVRQQLKDFIKNNKERKVALVTSGGTTVPLEKNTVRYLDNFSGGGRGSASAEHLIENGYAVIFLFRRHSLQPYGRHFLVHMDNNFLDYLNYNDEHKAVEVIPKYNNKITNILQKYHEATQSGRLLKVVFTSIHEYLFLLRECCLAVSHCGSKALIYSAAAVSDFYIPSKQMAEHKIQSSSGPLDLHLEPVPKMLAALRNQWSPEAFIVSFKLETDPSLLTMKAKKSLDAYQHQLVIGNLLQNHKDRVALYDPQQIDHPMVIERSPQEIKDDHDIEKALIQEVARRHEAFCK